MLFKVATAALLIAFLAPGPDIGPLPGAKFAAMRDRAVRSLIEVKAEIASSALRPRSIVSAGGKRAERKPDLEGPDSIENLDAIVRMHGR